MNAQTVTIEGKRFVILAEEDYKKLQGSAANGEVESLPQYPARNAQGRYSAVEFSRVSSREREERFIGGLGGLSGLNGLSGRCGLWGRGEEPNSGLPLDIPGLTCTFYRVSMLLWRFLARPRALWPLFIVSRRGRSEY